MKKLNLLLAVACLAALSACGEDAEVSEAETPVLTDPVDTGVDPVDTDVEETAGLQPTAAACTAYGAWDRNDNGLFEQAEYTAYGEGVFGDWDVDDDNRLALTEFNNCWGAVGWTEPDTVFTTFDDDNDGFLTETEFFAEDEFAEWDADDNNVLADNEWF